MAICGFGFCALFLCACHGHLQTYKNAKFVAPNSSSPIRGKALGKTIVQMAKQYVGKSHIPHFRADCSGTVRGIYALAGIDLGKASIPENDVRILYETIKRFGRLNRRPQLGDLVFFHHTYSLKKKSLKHSFFTHVGIVSDIKRNGDIAVIHHISGKIVESHQNDILRRKKGRDTQKTLADLFAGFGSIKK